MNTTRLLGLLGLGVLLLGGCAKPAAHEPDSPIEASAATFHIASGQYARAFDESRDELRDLGFLLDRVDAQLGVIFTQPKGTGGILTPWDQEQSGIGDKLEDAVQKHRRVVRIEFAPTGTDPETADVSDLRSDTRPMDAQVTVSLYRLYQPGWRLNPQAMLYSNYTHDPQLDERGMGFYSVALRQDNDLAERIAESVRKRLQRKPAGK